MLVVAALATAGLLFWSDARRSGEPRPNGTRTDPRELADPVLSVPEDGAAGADRRRRAERGRTRLDPGTAAEPRDDRRDASQARDEQLPPELDSVRGRRISVATASGSARAAVRERVRVAGLSVTCVLEADRAQRSAELELAAAVADMLEQAGATVIRLGNRDAPGECVDVRVRRMQRADVAVVLHVVDDPPERAVAGRPVSGTGSRSRAASLALARELASAVHARLDRGSAPSTRVLLARSAAIDLDGPPAVALLELQLPPPARRAQVTRGIARAIARSITEQGS